MSVERLLLKGTQQPKCPRAEVCVNRLNIHISCNHMGEYDCVAVEGTHSQHMDEPRKQAEWTRVYDLIAWDSYENSRPNWLAIEDIWRVVSSKGAEGRHRLGKVETELSGTRVMFYSLIGALVTQVNASVKTWNVHLKCVHTIVCKFSPKGERKLCRY